MKVLVTGSQGFLGKNLVATLKQIDTIEIYEYHRQSTTEELDDICKTVDFVFHLAGTNRPKDEAEFMEGNRDLTKQLLQILEENQNTCPLMFASSIQAEKENTYGQSKKAAEDFILEYGNKNNVEVFIYRFPNLFGKWSKPNYNTVIATFCHNMARDIPIQINDPKAELELAYIDDVIASLVKLLDKSRNTNEDYVEVKPTYKQTLGDIVEHIESFKQSRQNKSIPNMEDEFIKKLYSTYLSFLPENDFKYPLKMNIDDRGSFTEILKTQDRGQVSVNVSKPGITKGNHWHHTKNEKFLVVSGEGVIRFRKIDEEEVIEYFVSEDKLEVVDIPVGYTHNIENLGDKDMVTVMWVNEIFNPDEPDTYYLEV